jgi:hypothetical protein
LVNSKQVEVLGDSVTFLADNQTLCRNCDANGMLTYVNRIPASLRFIQCHHGLLEHLDAEMASMNYTDADGKLIGDTETGTGVDVKTLLQPHRHLLPYSVHVPDQPAAARSFPGT